MNWQDWSYGKQRMLSSMEKLNSPKKIKTWKYYVCCCNPQYKKYPSKHPLSESIIEKSNEECEHYDAINTIHNSDPLSDYYINHQKSNNQTWTINPGREK